ncbi:hypothetical protein LEP1GSC021_4528 [Leptospira noguchii str. 1993005606]|nr:hypothetical protein LEP1GSC021_4528 [Leptospira noguchii str. 1993005606]
MGSETLSSGERFALVHSSIPFALVQINKTASVGCFYKAEEN